MLEYAGESKSDYFSDQIDCLRYLFVSGADYITDRDMQVTGGGSY
jgi:hypothetical protein